MTKSLNIYFDRRALEVKGGSRTYASNLIQEIMKSKKVKIINPDQNSLLIKLFIKSKIITLIRLLTLFPINSSKVDVYHGLKNYLPPNLKCKTVVTIHDLTPFIMPSYFKISSRIWARIWALSVRKADMIIAVSECTKGDIIKFLKIDPYKIRTIYEGYDNSLYLVKNRKISLRNVSLFIDKKGFTVNHLDTKKIILNVNTIQPRKNLVNLIRSFNLIAEKDKDVILIISGKSGWKTGPIFKEFRKSPYNKRILFLGYTPNEIVSDLYNIASVFVYPSFYEGFGLPIIEAQACACPVITSNVSSLPEVSGEGAILIDPSNPNSIARAIKLLIYNKNIRDRLVTKGQKNCKRFSWSKTAQETIELYNELKKQN